MPSFSQNHFSPDTRLCKQHFRSVIFTSGYFCLGGGGRRVRSFRLGICEGSCINRTWGVGGPRLSLQKNVSSLNGEKRIKKCFSFAKCFPGDMPPNQEPITPRPHGGIGHVAPYFPLDGHSHNPSFHFDSLHARNEFYYQSNESIKSISP